MQTDQGCVRFRVWWQALVLDGATGVRDAFGQRFELLALQ
jgi:hypothetical protein